MFFLSLVQYKALGIYLQSESHMTEQIIDHSLKAKCSSSSGHRFDWSIGMKFLWFFRRQEWSPSSSESFTWPCSIFTSNHTLFWKTLTDHFDTTVIAIAVESLNRTIDVWDGRLSKFESFQRSLDDRTLIIIARSCPSKSDGCGTIRIGFWLLISWEVVIDWLNLVVKKLDSSHIFIFELALRIYRID